MLPFHRSHPFFQIDIFLFDEISMNSTTLFSTLSTTTTSINDNQDDLNGSLVDDWENYKAYTKFYHITDEIFLYANPILIIIGKFE